MTSIVQGGHSRRRFLCLTAAATGLATWGGWSGARAADAWPNRPIRVIVPYTPGGSTDVVTRTVMEKLGSRLGQTVVVENKPGANGMLGTAAGARSEPDGYNFVSVLAAHTINPHLYKSLLYKPADLVPVSHMAELPLFLFINKDVPANTVAELVAYGRANPGKLNYGSSGTGSSAHLTGANFAQVSGMQMQHIPYKGSAPILADLLGGQLTMVFDPILVPMAHVKTGKLKVLAITSATRWPDAPEVPTMEQAGYPGFVMSSWAGLMAPAGTSPAIIDRVSREIAQIVELPEVKATFKSAGFLPVGSTPAQFGELIDRDSTRYAGIIKAANVSVE